MLGNSKSTELIAIIQELSRVTSREEIMKIATACARRLLGSDGATFILKQEGNCFYADEDVISPLWKGHRFLLKNCISGWSMLNKLAVVIPDVYADARIPVESYRSTFVKSLIMVPIRQVDPIGAIGSYWTQSHQGTPEELEMLQTLADTVAIAMENVKLFENMREQIETLQANDKVNSEFLMNLSHELRNPLSSIIGWAQNLSQADSVTQDEIFFGLKAIERNAIQQLSIVDDVLDVANALSGRLVIERKAVKLDQILQQTMDAFCEQAKVRKISIHMDEVQEIGPILGDPRCLRQIFSKLLDNAVRFSRDGGSVNTILDKDQGFARVSIKDHGCGIEPEKLTLLFKPFQQIDGSRLKAHGGLGVGLSIAKSLAEAHGGHLIAASEGRGSGAVFSVYLPM